MHGLKSGSCRFWQRTDLPPGSNMHGLKSGSRRFWHRTDLPPGSNMHGLKSGSCRFWQRTDLPPGSKVVRADFGSGLICPRAQTCMDSKVVRAGFGSGLIRLRAQTCCALKSSVPSGARQNNCADLLGLQTRRGSNHSAAHVGESNSRSNVFQICRTSVCVSSRWKVLSGEFRRPPDFRTLYCLKWATSVEKRHGLPISEARRCSACANPLACPAVGKFSRASSAGGRRHL